jgi:membrane protein
MDLKTMFSLVKESVSQWQEDKASRMAAALAYYTVFSLAPLLVIAVAIAGFFLDRQAAARQEILAQIEDVVGSQGREATRTLIENASRPGQGILATVIGVVTLLLGASGAFGQLQDALNKVWKVKPAPDQGMTGMVQKRLLAFAMVLGTGLLLLASLVISTGISAARSFAGDLLPDVGILWQILNWALSIGLLTLVFGLIFKVLPDVEINWGDVWIGAAITSILFNLAQLLISLYLSKSSVGSAFGAAGSLAVLLVWIYYSAQILLLGAEFTQVYARRYGSHLEAKEGAMLVEEETGAEPRVPHERTTEAVMATRTSPAARPVKEPSLAGTPGERVEEPPRARQSPPSRPRPTSAGASFAIFGAVVGLMIVVGRMFSERESQ